ncbi:MAG: MoaD/ThiS family protein [Rhodospirillales bacterium]
MPTVRFTSQLERFISAPPAEAAGDTLGDVLGAIFADNPVLRGYILDDQGAVRPHVQIFVAGAPASDRRTLSDPVNPDDEIYVFQALSGG